MGRVSLKPRRPAADASGMSAQTMASDLTQPDEVVLLSDATTAEWGEILEHSSRLLVPAGELIFAAEDRSRSLCLVIEGQVSAIAENDGPVIRTMPAPAVLGEVAFLDGAGRSLLLRADVETDLLVLTWDDFEALRARNPDLAHRLLLDLARIVAGRLRGMTDVVIRSLPRD